MKITRSGNGIFFIEASEGELVTINNCINDASDLLGDAEFQIRVGVNKNKASALLETIRIALMR